MIRAVQECLNNIIKHSIPSKISITIKKESTANKLIIQDDGKGFDLEAKTTGTGLINLKRRLEKVGGNILVNSQREKGATITLGFPTS